MNNTIEIIKEARKAGMQVALIMFGAFLVVSLLFSLYIWKSFSTVPTASIEATQTTDVGDNNINQGNK